MSNESFEAAEKLRNEAQDAEREIKGLLTTGEAILADRQQELDVGH